MFTFTFALVIYILCFGNIYYAYDLPPFLLLDLTSVAYPLPTDVAPIHTFWSAASREAEGNPFLIEHLSCVEGLIRGNSGKGSTVKKYDGAIKRYMSFAGSSPLMVGRRGWPVDEVSFAVYLGFLWRAKGKVSALKLAFAAIRWRHKVEGHPTPGDSPTVRALMVAADRALLERVRRKFGLTPEQVRQLLQHLFELHVAEPAHGWDRLSVLVQIQYEGIARVGEVLGLVRSQIEFIPGGMRIFVRGKTHLTRREGDYKYFQSVVGASFDAVSATRAYLRERGCLFLEREHLLWESPIFPALSYERIRKDLILVFKRAGLNPILFGSHSFRSGACSAALRAGVPRDIVMRQGQWVSDAIDGYFLPCVGDLMAPSRNVR